MIFLTRSWWRKKGAYRLAVAGLGWVLSSCLGTRYVQPGEHLLYGQQIKGSKQVPAEDLEAYYRQKPNRKLLLFAFSPYLVAYYEGKKGYDKQLAAKKAALKYEEDRYANLLTDSTLNQRDIRRLTAKRNKVVGRLRTWVDEGNWLMRSVGEKPVLFDSVLMKKTADQMQLALRQRGYFSAKVAPSYQLKDRTATVVYQVTEGLPHHVRSLARQLPDSVLQRIIVADSNRSLLRVGQVYDETALGRERDRLARLLRDYGYYDLPKDFIFFDVDTLNPGPRLVDLRLVIEPPGKNQAHRQFKVDDITVTADVGVETERAARDTTFYPNRLGVKFISFSGTGRVPYKNRVVYERIRLQKGQPFSQSDVEETQRNLAGMDMFRSINFNADTLGGRLVGNLFANPLPRNDISLEGGLNVTQAALPGPFLSVALKNRNTFNGYEVLEFRFRGALDAQFGAAEISNTYNSQELSLNGSLVFPRLLLPLSATFKRRIGINLGRTRLSSGFTFFRRPEYDRMNLQATWGYEWFNRARNKSYTLNLADVNVVNTPRADDSFILYLLELAAGGNTLLRSFSSLLVSSVSFNYQYYDPKRPDALYFRAFVESGGTTLNFLPNQLLRQNPTFLGLEYFRFLKTNAELRYYVPRRKGRTWAFRANVGVARPYGNLGDARNTVLPYEKYFFTGGSNSIRAWRPRRLGPGSYAAVDPESGRLDQRFEQPGELLVELNAEYRTKLFSFVNGAFFVDAGNVWMLTADSRPGSRFRFNTFLPQFAVGTGVGLRFDFSFVIMRVDLGMRLYDPALPQGSRFVLGDFDYAPPLLNIGIGYPF
jgi:outer membrane protein insertion porin family